MKKIDPKKVSLGELHGLLLGAVCPRPIAFVSTIDGKGNINLSPFSFFNAFSVNPPVLVFSPSRRGRDNTTKHSYDNVVEVPECVVSIVNYDMVQQTSLSSTEYAQGVNEYIKSGLTQVPSERVKPPRVGESPVSFECLVKNIVPLGEGGGSGNLVISEIILIHINENILNENGQIEPSLIDTVGRMGGNYYTRANGESLLQVPKPNRNIGIGIDQIPEKIRDSKILTGNDLGKLGNIESLPTKEEIESIKSFGAVQGLLLQKDSKNFEYEVELLAKGFLDKGDIETAWKILLIK